MNVAIYQAQTRRRNLRMVTWIAAVVVLIVVGGGVYMVHIANSTQEAPTLPAGPPHAQRLAQTATTDMLQGNFILSSALYRSTDSPTTLVAFYRRQLHMYSSQVGNFNEVAHSVLPARAPEALQHVPPAFVTATSSDPRAATYLYTEYHTGINDVGVAIDARNPQGSTLVYIEMLTNPTN